MQTLNTDCKTKTSKTLKNEYESRFASEIFKYVVFSMYDNTNTKSEHRKSEQKQKRTSTNSMTKMNKNTVPN